MDGVSLSELISIFYLFIFSLFDESNAFCSWHYREDKAKHRVWA
jgi:hypothetical protein